MKEMKFRVHSPEHSKAIQERLFELGYKWYSCVQQITKTDKPFLYAEEDGSIKSDDIRYSSEFLDYPHEETTLDDLYKMTAKERITIGSKVVEFTKKGIKVGCTEVDKETILKIAKHFQDK